MPLHAPPLTLPISFFLNRCVWLLAHRLSHLAHCHSIQLWLQREYGVSTTIMLNRQAASKWRRARDSVVKCFPTFRKWKFQTEAHSKYLTKRKLAQKKLLGERTKLLNGINRRENRGLIEQALQEFSNKTAMAMQSLSSENENHTITIPFLHANEMLLTDLYVDKFADDLRQYLQFDYDSCCKLRPDPDESVFVSYYYRPRSEATEHI